MRQFAMTSSSARCAICATCARCAICAAQVIARLGLPGDTAFDVHAYYIMPGGGQWPHYDVGSPYTTRLVLASHPSYVSLHEGVPTTTNKRRYTPFIAAAMQRYGYFMSEALGKGWLGVAHAAACDVHMYTIVISFKGLRFDGLCEAFIRRELAMSYLQSLARAPVSIGYDRCTLQLQFPSFSDSDSDYDPDK